MLTACSHPSVPGPFQHRHLARRLAGVQRIEFFGTWQGLGQRRTLTMNQARSERPISLFTPATAPTTPAQAGVFEIVLTPFPAAAPEHRPVGTVVAGNGRRRDADPAGRRRARRPWYGRRARSQRRPRRFERDCPPDPDPGLVGVVNAVGGGPVLVRDGGPSSARTRLHDRPARSAAPRAAIGQLADGRILLVTSTARRPGYSVGMTNFELALALVRLGAVTASALDGGGSSAMAFEGTLLNRPSGRERAIARPRCSALLLRRLCTAAARVVLSPNGDGVAESQRARVQGRASLERHRDARRSGQRARLHRNGRPCPRHLSGRVPAGAARPDCSPRASRRRPLAARRIGDRRPRPDLDHEPAFTVNSTLGFAKLSRRSLTVRVRGKQVIQAGVTLRGPHGCSPPSRPFRASASRRLRCAAFRRAASSRAGRERPSAADPSSTAASTRSGSAPPTSSAWWRLTTQAFRVTRAAPLPPKNKPKPPASSG